MCEVPPGVVTHHPAAAHPVIVALAPIGQGTLGQWLGTLTCERQVPGSNPTSAPLVLHVSALRNPLCRVDRPYKDGSPGT